MKARGRGQSERKSTEYALVIWQTSNGGTPRSMENKVFLSYPFKRTRTQWLTRDKSTIQALLVHRSKKCMRAAVSEELLNSSAFGLIHNRCDSTDLWQVC